VRELFVVENVDSVGRNLRGAGVADAFLLKRVTFSRDPAEFGCHKLCRLGIDCGTAVEPLESSQSCHRFSATDHFITYGADCVSDPLVGDAIWNSDLS
jgi:hypothetical protein